MKKMNNKGFAISTVIYGLSIMGIMIVAILMAILAQTRSNTKQLVKSIEDDLNRFSRTEASFRALSDEPIAQEYNVPETGWYRIELWGSKNVGYGAYTSGVIKLNEGDTIYFYVGRNGSETDVRLNQGEYKAKESYFSRLMVAAGGGSSAGSDGGTLYGYSSKQKTLGGYIKNDFSLYPRSDSSNNTNGTLVGFPKDYEGSPVSYEDKVDEEVETPHKSGGGGDGIIPGESADYGGVSYIAGYAGCLGVDNGMFSNSPLLIYEQTDESEEEETEGGEEIPDEGGSGGEESSDDTLYDDGYYFLDGFMFPGVNNGDGHAKIAKIANANENQYLARKTTSLDNVQYIKDCLVDANLGSEDSPYGIGISWTDIKWSISAISNGIDETKSDDVVVDEVYHADNENRECKKINLGKKVNLDEIAVFHQNGGIDSIGEKLFVSDTGFTGMTTVITNQVTAISETETATGIRVSAYQHDSKGDIENGNYIILPVLDENKVLTASIENGTDPITTELYNGYNRQMWNIEKVGTNQYKISELSRFKFLALNGNTAVAEQTPSQIWNIEKVQNNTYYISQNGNYLISKNNQLKAGNKNETTSRFKLININYSSN